MHKLIEQALKDLLGATQAARLYGVEHPKFAKMVDIAYASLLETVKESDLVIGIVGEEFAAEKEIFFELSKLLKPMILSMKARNIDKITITNQLQRQELIDFIGLVTAPSRESDADIGAQLEALRISGIRVGKFKGNENVVPAGNAPDESMEKKYEKCLETISTTMDAVLDSKTMDSMALMNTINSITENLGGKYQEFLQLVTVKRYDQKTYQHSLNVCILTVHFASYLGFSKQDVWDIGAGALFHDIGKLHISRKVIQKPAQLTLEETASMKSHVIFGSQILLNYKQTLGMLPVVICFEHHLKYDLTGYPRISWSSKPHITSMITSICDVYDALFSRRSYKREYPPELIYEIMSKESGTSFEPSLLKTFFSLMGVFPLSTKVLLSNKRVGVVRKQNEDDISRPIVEVSANGSNELLDLKAIPSLSIEKSLPRDVLDDKPEGKDKAD